MLQLANKTPYAAERTIVMDKRGEKRWVVAVRATYRIGADGRTVLADEQKPPLHQAEHRGDPGATSIVYEADLVPTKRRTDVLLNAQAHAPSGRAVSQVDVGMVVGPVRKQLRVHGDRHWSAALPGLLKPSAAQRFERLPIVYERAYGGWDRSSPDATRQRLWRPNPVGQGFATAARQLEGRPLPNIEQPGRSIAHWDDRPAVAGFGAIASWWSPRIESAGTYDAAWKQRKFPLLPDDFDEQYHQAAPADQQTPQPLRGGEPVELTHLTPSGRLAFTLPRVYLVFKTRFGRRQTEHRATLQTVVIEPDVPQVVLVWQTSLACHHLLDELDETVIREKAYP